MKLLFISLKDVNTTINGGGLCTSRNYMSFAELLGKENVDVHNVAFGQNEPLLKRILKWINYIFGFWGGLSFRKIAEINELSKGYDFVFLDTSQIGVIARYLKKHSFNGLIISFFHNIEHNIQAQKIKAHPLDFWRLLLVRYNEICAVKYADEVVVLNNRDGDELKRLYGDRSFKIIPISLVDSYTESGKRLTSLPPVMLFIGNNWYPNIQGLRWFVNNVLDEVAIKLQIVGSEMDDYRDEFSHKKIEFIGFAPKLNTLIMNADCVLSPIFTGSGMKVKTCEALMWGKHIIGTYETFEGYDLNLNSAGELCNTKEEFIKAIEYFSSQKRERFNEYNRNIYLEKYSFHATLKLFQQLLIRRVAPPFDSINGTLESGFPGSDGRSVNQRKAKQSHPERLRNRTVSRFGKGCRCERRG